MKNRNTIGVVFAQINNETVGPCPERQSKVWRQQIQEILVDCWMNSHDFETETRK
jgi:hypothetical protein